MAHSHVWHIGAGGLSFSLQVSPQGGAHILTAWCLGSKRKQPREKNQAKVVSLFMTWLRSHKVFVCTVITNMPRFKKRIKDPLPWWEEGHSHIVWTACRMRILCGQVWKIVCHSWSAQKHTRPEDKELIPTRKQLLAYDYAAPIGGKILRWVLGTIFQSFPTGLSSRCSVMVGSPSLFLFLTILAVSLQPPR